MKILHFIINDNDILRNLCGALNENLKYISEKLDVKLYVRGNIIIAKGSLSSINKAKPIIEKIITLAEDNNIFTPSMIHNLMIDNLPQLNSENTTNITTKIKKIYPKNRSQETYIKLLQSSQILFAIGPAGTGKTHLAVAYAIQSLEKGFIDKVIISRPAVESGEKLGFLPGDMKEKIDPYLRPIYDSLYDMLTPKKANLLIQNNIIEIAPLAFMRGRSFNNALVILDEAQNTTSAQMKMFLTRLGEGSKMVISGDISQVDLPKGQTSGLKEALYILADIEKINTVYFSENDIVRHPLVSEIVKAYNNHAN